MTDNEKLAQAEKALHRKEKYYRTILSHLHDEIFVIDRSNRITDANKDFLAATGDHRNELIGRSYIDVFKDYGTGDDHIEDKLRLGGVFKTGDSAQCRLEGRTAEDLRTFLDIVISPIRDMDQRVTHVIMAVRDVTTEVLLQESMNQMNKIQAVGTLAGGIAHEFNNILMSILLNVESVLKSYKDNAFIRESLTIAYKASLNARDLIQQLLLFGRQSGQAHRPLFVSPLVKEASKLFQASLPETIKYDENIRPDSDRVLASPEEIHQIFINLLTNAADAMGEKGGSLTVTLDNVTLGSGGAGLIQPDLEPGTYLRLTVKDTGQGIADDDLPRIFDPFFTLNDPGSRTGMGLSIIHGIVDNLDGAVTVDSELGKGSVFNVLLPVTEQAKAAEPEPVPSISSKGEHLLLVDDNALIVNTLESILARHGYQVSCMTESSEALELFKKNPDRFDLMITDLVMPGMDGVELIKEVFAVRADMPVILLTGVDVKADRKDVDELGIEATVTKPVLFSELDETIRKILKEKVWPRY